MLTYDFDRIGGIFSLTPHFAKAKRSKPMSIDFKSGEIIDGKYKVLELLGQGGMGAVLKIEVIADKRLFALKYCSETDAELVKRFAREVRIALTVKHQNVVEVGAPNLAYAPPYFLMPLATNSIQAEVDKLKKDEAQALDTFEQICFGIQAIHNSGCVHRDIKPLNALRFADGRVAVSDLGLAKLDPRDTTTITQTNVLLGTRAYCAPEQLLPGGSREADQRTDIYQLGKTLYEILTGKCPALMNLKDLPSGLSYIIQKATREQPDERWQTLGQLMDAVKGYRLSKDPKHHPQEAFGSLVSEANVLLSKGEFDEEILRKMLAILSNGISLDARTMMVLFESIPAKLLQVMARELTADFLTCLEKYAASVKEAVHGFNYEYAEIVANRMKIVVSAIDAGKSPALKKAAILATLFAAVDRRRFAAMNVFDEMLINVKDGGDAVATADGLRQNINIYKTVAARVPAAQLNAAIREVQREAIGGTSPGSF